MKPKIIISVFLVMLMTASAASAACSSGTTCKTSCGADFVIKDAKGVTQKITCSSSNYCSVTLQKGVKYCYFDKSAGSPGLWYWSFKNNCSNQVASSRAQNTCYTFKNAGNYCVVLSVGKCTNGVCSWLCSKTVRVTVK